MSRLGTISDNQTNATDAAFTYLGLGTIVVEDELAAGVKLDYISNGGNLLSGFDRFAD